MKTCPKCGELNGENRSECFKCKASLGAASTYKKICPKCKTLYSGKSETCENCGNRLAVYDDNHYSHDASSHAAAAGGCWMYLVSVLIPIIGIILGCIYIARGEDDLGKSLIITSVVTIVVFTVIGVLLASCGVLG
ncbi:MAG TPA: hypothetical protein DD640_06780 [Clostridiales bacterium]|nr:hypothetical protein [Clostridiales bacterium]